MKLVIEIPNEEQKEWKEIRFRSLYDLKCFLHDLKVEEQTKEREE